MRVPGSKLGSTHQVYRCGCVVACAKGRAMNSAAEFRKNAQIALMRARIAHDVESRREWVNVANEWTALAREWLSSTPERVDRHEIDSFIRQSTATRH
jgi:predicted membrane chloride channel (bestrophin family)